MGINQKQIYSLDLYFRLVAQLDYQLLKLCNLRQFLIA